LVLHHEFTEEMPEFDYCFCLLYKAKCIFCLL